jgi:GNAT superfamily N-acetyltransferase
MALKIVPFEERHLPEAAALVARRYRALRSQVPYMPSWYEHGGSIEPLLAWITANFEGVVALHRGQVAGLLVGMVLDEFRGQRAVFSPEWANGAVAGPGADGLSSGPVYRAMYAELSEQWLAQGCGRHLVSVMAHDQEGIDAWHWSGFGKVAADAVRRLEPLGRKSRSLARIRRAVAADAEAVARLQRELKETLAGAPTFLYYDPAGEDEDFGPWLQGETHALWLVEVQGDPVAYMRAGPANEDACTIIRDHGTCSITGALTQAQVRGTGLGAVLLEQVLAWARAMGYERCAVDFEPENVEGARFWMNYFEPVCFALSRQIDLRFLDR